MGHPLYSEASQSHPDPKTGIIHPFQACFGQMIDADGNYLWYTMERLDTLIEEGIYEFMLMWSDANQCIVPVLIGVPHMTKIEVHPVNWTWQLEGCTGVGEAININVPQINPGTSRAAFDKMMKMICGDTPPAQMVGKVLGTFAYEKYVPQAA